jgi:diguanylate cyclase (GGDEF)-like protein
MIDTLANILVITGAAVLIGALIPVRRLIGKLPEGPIAAKWYVLTALIVLFVIGYGAYAVVFWGRHAVWADVIVPGVFLFGAIFVWGVARLSLQTAIDLGRVALLERESITDPLTGVYNRRYMDRRIEEEIARALRYAHPLSVLLMDVDHFKSINDRYGHQGGDEVLRHLGRLIMHAVREVDVVTRYGGEELLIIAPDTTLDTAIALAERLRLHSESRELVLTDADADAQPQVLRITVSIGVATLHPDAANGGVLVREADEALYRAKAAGRNRVVAYRAGMAKGA